MVSKQLFELNSVRLSFFYLNISYILNVFKIRHSFLSIAFVSDGVNSYNITRMVSIFRFYILFFSINIFVLHAQKEAYHFKHISTEQGLSSNLVVAIEQDQLGQIWFGTRNGLNKYNGVDVEVFTNIPKDSLSLSNNDILTVLEDRDGFIWVGTYNGLNKYNPVKNTFKRYYRRESKSNSLVNTFVLCSKEMPNGELWFGTANGISIYNKATDDFKNIYTAPINGNVKAFKRIQSIYADTSNQVWLATRTGLAKLVPTKDNPYNFKMYNWSVLEKDLFIHEIIEVKPGVLGIGTKYNGYLLFNIAQGTFERLANANISPTADVRSLAKANDGNIWIGTTNGIHIVNTEGKVTSVKEDPNTFSGISQNYIKAIFKDRNGSMWLGTFSGGANIWNRINENFVRLKSTHTNNSRVTAIVNDDASNVYFATEQGNINKLDNQGTISSLLKVSKQKDSSLTYPIQTLLYTKPGLLWVGVLDRGVFIYDIATKQRRNDIISKELQEYLGDTGVYVIKEDAENGVFWFGTLGKGLVGYNTRTKSLIKIQRPDLTTNVVKTILVDAKGAVWIGGGLGGVNKISFKPDGSYNVSKYLNENPFSRFSINTIYKDRTNTIWLGTNTKGLYKYDGKSFSKKHIDVKNPVSTIYSILEGDEGYIWMATNKGVVKYDTKTRKSTVYNQKDILSYSGFNVNSSLSLPNSQFYFGGYEGVITFNTKRIYKNEYVPKVLLSDLKIKNQSVKVSSDDAILFKSVSYAHTIQLKHDNANFSISYALPNFTNPEHNYYAYRLKGLDEAWTYTKKTEAFYTLQSSGDYIFEVKGANSHGVWNHQPAKLRIVVHPAPWLSWWAIAIYCIFIIVGLSSLYWILQSRSRLRHKLELEYVESKRSEELNKAKLQFFTNISHEFRTPLTLILGPLQQLLKQYDGSPKMFKKLKVIESSANHLLRLINRLMDFRKLEHNQLKLEAAQGNIVKFLREIFLSFQEYAKIGGYTYTFESEDDKIVLYFDRYKLERVFYNLISNAFKYTEKGGQITVEVVKADGGVCIRVRDNGIGVAEEYIDKIFDRFFEASTQQRPEETYKKGTGIGLAIANNIVKLHRGTLEVENVKPKGAVFTVKLKQGKAHFLEDEILKDFKMSDEVSQYATQLEALKMSQTDEVLESSVVDEKKYTLLVVEDNKLLRSFMKELLRQDYNVLQAENGAVALEKAQKHLPDLIVSDVIMPEMVGTELCSKIKADINTSHIPVVLLTSRTSLIYKFEGLESGADDYISKPFNLREFQLRIHNLLESQERIKNKFAKNDIFIADEIAVTTIDEKLLKKAFKVVEDHMDDENFDVETFAMHLGVSRSLLFTKIKAWTNFTPNEFVREIRLKYAAKLLENKAIRIAEVSNKVGFKRAKYFSQCFQKKYGMTPTQYAEKNLK